MWHLQVGKRTVRKTAASVGEHQIGRQSFSDVAAFVRISGLQCHPKIGQMTQCKRVSQNLLEAAAVTAQFLLAT
jgi:hypothetical protein